MDYGRSSLKKLHYLCLNNNNQANQHTFRKMASLHIKPNTGNGQELEEFDKSHQEQCLTSEKAYDAATLQKRKKIRSSFKWSIQENQIYAQCILEYEEMFVSQRVRRQKKVFKIMEVRMGGRKTSEQCRGHHKKFIENYGTIERIVNVLKAKKEKKQKNKHLGIYKNQISAKSGETNQSGPNSETFKPKQQSKKKRGRKPKNQAQVASNDQLNKQLSYISTYLTL